VVLFDEADLYLPAVGKPVTKEPMENALRRWRSAGLGVLLASQSPGDFDYRCRENVRNWFVGRVKEDTALHKMRPMLKEARTDIAAKLPGLEAGQFFLVREGQVESLAAARSLVAAEQLPETEILRLAAGGG
jgi:DNA helicase HerA-like ATPase